MSIHSSLKISGALVGRRSVWTRVERLAALKQEGKWSEGDPVLGLPKVVTGYKEKSKKQLKADAAEDAGAEAPAEGAAAEADENASGKAG